MDKEENFPLGSTILKNKAYVDDIHFGGDSIEEVQEGIRQLRGILKTASFEVRKFARQRDFKNSTSR
jgi:hypothetical protein